MRNGLKGHIIFILLHPPDLQLKLQRMPSVWGVFSSQSNIIHHMEYRLKYFKYEQMSPTEVPSPSSNSSWHKQIKRNSTKEGNSLKTHKLPPPHIPHKVNARLEDIKLIYFGLPFLYLLFLCRIQILL